MPTLEQSVADLATANAALTNAVLVRDAAVAAAQATFAATTTRVNALSNVSNTADADKPISTVAQAALNAKQPTLVSGLNLKSINGVSLLGADDLVVLSAPTSLRYVSYANRSTLRVVGVPVPIADDTTVVEGLGLFNFVANTAEPDDDETCFTTTTLSGQWLLAVPAIDLLAAWALVENSIRDELDEDEITRLSAYFAAK